MLTLTRRFAMTFAFLLIAVCAVGQDRYQWRTAADIREGGRGRISGTVADVNDARNELTLYPDDDSGGGVRVIADSVSTQFNGFGGVINGKPEIFMGSKGFSNLRTGDRIEVVGTARGNAAVQAEQITLRGRSVAVPPTGVGDTRPPTSASTPTQTTVTADRLSRIEGIVRQVNADNNAIVMETDRREMITVRGSASTPVYYQNDVYHISNLEVGDRIRVEPDTAASTTGDVRARVIDVVRAVQDAQGGGSVGAISGSVTRIDRPNNIVTVDTGRGQTRVDVANSTDGSGRRIRAGDLQVGDRVEISGRYNPTGDLFLATTVRFNDDVFNQPRPTGPMALGSVTIYGNVTQSLANSAQLVIRDAQNRSFTLFVLEDFVVRTKSNGYTTADRLKEGDSLVVKAYRDSDGNYVAQTIRMR